ncbi:SAF domain-containing protein [Pseudofrankia sp. BMG5.37]|uniref:SAF domain-containing protein n=1 Tax=Pseudofrankia sp. BMG5.37 TaxID=3050035 RepID=UPI0028955D47|nr:SAF domain-containing protein [Pseudofrankia sp. BMG5.37]MDT3438992.1 SAF domain-containing protein [Pseudofrankia sp. BMG5.37]
MTDLAPAFGPGSLPDGRGSSGRSADPIIPPSPPARRLGRRGWRDTRLLFGVLLVLVSVVIGARLFATADRTAAWVAAKTNLPAGHVVTAADLVTVRAQLDDDTAARYYPGRRSNEVIGGTLARPVGKGELLSGGDFAGPDAGATRIVPVVVKAGRVPPLTPGDHVDVYVYQPAGAVDETDTSSGSGTSDGATGPSDVGTPAAGGAGAEVLVLHDVEFLGEQRIATGDRSLTLRVPVDAAIRAVAASQSERVDVVKLERDGRGQVGDTGPTAAQGYGR